MVTFFRYSGSKVKYTDIINSFINNTKQDVYIEPFIGSGAVLFNLRKKFKHYIINDLDENIIKIYKTFKEIDYKDYLNELDYVKKNFNFTPSKTLRADTLTKTQIKDYKTAYYNFRDYFNKNYWNTNTTKEGIYLHFLANSCINSFFRFGPNGFNAAYGFRFYKIPENEFNIIKEKLKKTEILNEDYKNINEKGLYFLDPPYFMRDSSYSGFNQTDMIEFINYIKNKEYVYTDIINDYNKNLKNIIIREISGSSPSGEKQGTGHMEHLFYSKNLKPTIEEW